MGTITVDPLFGTIPDHPSIRYMRSLYEPDDLVCIWLIDPKTDEQEWFIQPLAQAAEPGTVKQIDEKQALGRNVYVCMNSLKQGSTTRSKKTIEAIRTVYTDIDTDGETKLALIRSAVAAKEIPTPHFVLKSSPGKFQIVWKVTGFTQAQQEVLNKGLAAQFGGDPAATDSARILRLPGFMNMKYPTHPEVDIIERNEGPRYRLEDFKFPVTVEEKVAKTAISSDKLGHAVERMGSALDEAEVAYSGPDKSNGGFEFSLSECPWGDEHSNGRRGDAGVHVDESGAPSFHCFHSHCAERHWKEFREVLERRAGHPLQFADPRTDTVTIGGREPGTAPGVAQAGSPSAEPSAAPVVAPLNVSIPYSDAIFYGLAGSIIRKLQPQTESHPVGNLLELLATFGNIIGPNPYYLIEDTKHFCNLFVVKVGRSSKSRKGTGSSRIARIAQSLDLTWFTSRNTSGIGSGEVIVWEVRDPITGVIKNKSTGEVHQGITDPGIDDKRLFIAEGEFAGILAVAGRKDSLLSKMIRDAWDHKPIRNKSKGSSAVCLNPHISTVADITGEELRFQLKESDRFNGFGNRFLWCFVERQALLPHGGEDIDWSEEIVELHKAIDFARMQRRVFMDRNARLMWERMYEELSEDIPGLIGAVTSRAEAQTIRLALIFAMLDLSDHITVEHLKAARALWQYCEDSARIIFGGVTKLHQRILDFLQTGPKSLTDILVTLFSKNRRKEEIKSDLNFLLSAARIMAKTGDDGIQRFQLPGA